MTLKTAKRISFLRAMELIARSTNNEDFIYDIWRLNGVPDGAIYGDTPDEEIEWLTDDRYFANIMDAFLDTMFHARIDGGLYFDGVLSEHQNFDEDDGLPEYELDTEE